ncbi:MAG: AMP-binding protein [Gammaproteobacteria bacterium]|nr:AMP-binding protein [Gammaproteobacteria bacterium]
MNETTDSNLEQGILMVLEALAAELHRQRGRGKVFGLDSHLERDLGLDSLARVEFIARIEEHFGVNLPEQVYGEIETPRDLLRFLRAAGPTATAGEARSIPASPAKETQGEPLTANTLIEVLQWHVEQHPERVHIQFYQDEGEGERIRYGDLWEHAVNIAAVLQERGVERGEPVAIMLPTGPDYFYSFYGILLAGGVPVSLYPPARRAQVADHLRRHAGILHNCRARILVTVEEAKPFTRLLKSLADTTEHVLTLADLDLPGGHWQPQTIQGQDTAFLQYTSGSTGDPKGVVLSHANLVTNIRLMGEAVHADSRDVFVSWLPLYHDMGLIGAWLGSLYYGSLFVVMSPLTFIARPIRWLRAIHRYGGTLSAAPNFAYELCLRRVRDEEIADLDLGSWRCAFNGAEPVYPETTEQFCERFAGHGFRRESMMPVYGLAENCVGLAFPPLGRGLRIDAIQREAFATTGHALPAADTDANALRFVACGLPLAEHELRVVDENGRELSERMQGRLQFHGPCATTGYYRNRSASRKLFSGDWLNTGDMAYLVGGEVYLTGRSKDIIIRAGRNLYPHELEEAVGELAGVRRGRVAVFGSRPASAGTEQLVILAETRLKEAGEREALRERIQELAVDLSGDPADDIVLAPPNTVLKTSSGKVRRSACRELYKLGHIHQAPAPPWRQWLSVTLESLGPRWRRSRRNGVAWLYASWLWSLLVLLAIPAWIGVALLPGRSTRWRWMRLWARLLLRASRLPVSTRGLERLPPPEQPCVLVANHQSYLDGLVLCALLPHPVMFVAKAELQQRFFARIFLRGIGTCFVERFRHEQSVADAHAVTARLHAGATACYFPEGTFTRSPGLLPFRMGAFLAAVEAGVPLVPLTLRGTRSVLRAGSWFPRFGTISLLIDAPIPARASIVDERERFSTAVTLRDQARAVILHRCGEPDQSPR